MKRTRGGLLDSFVTGIYLHIVKRAPYSGNYLKCSNPLESYLLNNIIAVITI